MNENYIIRFLNEELSESEKRIFYDWLNNSPENQKLFLEIKTSWHISQLSNNNQTIDSGSELQLFKYRLNDRLKYRKTILLYRTLLGAAAAFLLVLGFSVFYYRLGAVNPQTTGSAFNEISTNASEKSKIVLADGSKIWINACSRLKYPSNLNSDQIDIYLEGEAYFDLKKIKGRKITVHTSEIDVKVIGTAFNLRNYKDEDIIETTLIRGKVEIERKSGSKKGILELQPSQSASFIKNSNKNKEERDFAKLYINHHENTDQTREIAIKQHSNMVVAKSINSELLVGWKEGKLSFRDESFESLAKKLEKWYGVTINIRGQELKEARFTGSFSKETIEQALRALSYPVPFMFKIDKDSVRIELKNVQLKK